MNMSKEKQSSVSLRQMINGEKEISARDIFLTTRAIISTIKVVHESGRHFGTLSTSSIMIIKRNVGSAYKLICNEKIVFL